MFFVGLRIVGIVHCQSCRFCMGTDDFRNEPVFAGDPALLFPSTSRVYDTPSRGRSSSSSSRSTKRQGTPLSRNLCTMVVTQDSVFFTFFRYYHFVAGKQDVRVLAAVPQRLVIRVVPERLPKPAILLGDARKTVAFRDDVNRHSRMNVTD